MELTLQNEASGQTAANRGGQAGVTLLGSGSRGNALVVHGERGSLLIDAGFSLKQTLTRMQECGIDIDTVGAILVSHEHGDHVRGVGVVSRRMRVPVFCNRAAAGAIRERGLDGRGAINIFSAGGSFDFDEFRVTPFSVPHDARDTVGFSIDIGSFRIGVATDLGHATQPVLHHLRECDILVVESNHDPAMLRNSRRPWPVKQRINGRHGHLSNEDCMQLLQKVVAPRTRHVIMAHASEECNRYELVGDLAGQCLESMGRADVAVGIGRQDRPLPTCFVGG